jgi:hypothetical protein
MGWERGRYYTRSKKVRGRVVREYIGTGPAADLAAHEDELRRRLRDAERENRRAERAALQTLDAPADRLFQIGELLARATLLVAGFRQHHRGEWRKSRVKSASGLSREGP